MTNKKSISNQNSVVVDSDRVSIRVLFGGGNETGRCEKGSLGFWVSFVYDRFTGLGFREQRNHIYHWLYLRGNNSDDH